jgi:hypothetical protein
MVISILPPPQPVQSTRKIEDDSDEEDVLVDNDMDGDIQMDAPSKKTRQSRKLVTPGEIITDDTRWMR